MPLQVKIKIRDWIKMIKYHMILQWWAPPRIQTCKFKTTPILRLHFFDWVLIGFFTALLLVSRSLILILVCNLRSKFSGKIKLLRRSDSFEVIFKLPRSIICLFVIDGSFSKNGTQNCNNANEKWIAKHAKYNIKKTINL